ncbi:MAG: PQQ-dependent sugar dehydrogenase [Planctomycetota bacterium]
MFLMIRGLMLTAITFLIVPCVYAKQPDRRVDPKIYVRSGYKLTVAEATLKKPRFMEVDPEGTLYVSQPNLGEIKACRDADGDGYYETVTTFVSGHRTAHGMYWHGGWLWFTESTGIFRARNTKGDYRADEEVTVIPRGELPGGSGHWWRPILIHNHRIYTGVGDRGNISKPNGKRQKIWTYALDGSSERLFCSGIRNTEKLVVRPGTDEIWGMDHGSDWFGRYLEKQDDKASQPITDLNPPCEMNRYVQDGFYGHPYVVGIRIPRYEYMDRSDIVDLASKTIPPEWSTGAHWAPNAMEFYTHERFPNCRGDAFVAYHGSWNRSQKAGYCVTRVLFDGGHPYGELVYVRFLDDKGKVLGRPVDCAQLADGSLLISDDHHNRIYRLQYEGGATLPAPTTMPTERTRASKRSPSTEPAYTATQHSNRRMVDLDPGPMTRFEKGCARCHGPYGTFYGEGFGRKSDHELRKVVKEMLEGPADMHSDTIFLDAMVAYQHALDDDRPFLCVTNGKTFLAGQADTLSGEVTPGSTVTIRANEKTLSAQVSDHTWKLTNPPQPPMRIMARKGQIRTILQFPDSIWSHAKAAHDDSRQ